MTKNPQNQNSSHIPHAFNCQSTGEPFSKETIQKVWEKARSSQKNHSFIYSVTSLFNSGVKKGTHVMDDYGHILAFDEFGQSSKNGWHIDHIHPVSKKDALDIFGDISGKSIDDIENLRVLHWSSNETKKDLDARVYELEYERFILNKSA